MVDITSRVQKAVKGFPVGDGICHIYGPHTTAGVTINENADPSVTRDILMELNKKIPFEDGICYVYVPHTTAGVTVNENADPSVTRDILMELNKKIPFEDGYAHTEGNSAAHIKASLMGSSAAIPVAAGTLQLGTWQGIYFCEFDGSRRRRVVVTVMSGS